MAFDIKKFNNANFKPRTREVEVAALQAFFDADEKPVFTLRNLSAEEFAAVRESAEKASKREAITAGLVSPDHKEQVNAIRTALGIAGDMPVDLIKRFDVLTFGCMQPVLDRETVIKFARHYPTPFYNLTNIILNLTGEGSDPGKLPGSGVTKESKSP